MPCGLGIHPYFNCGPQTRIRTAVTDVWTVDDKVLPVDKLPATGRYAIADEPVCGRGLDNGYDGWGGEAVFSDPDWPFDIALTLARHPLLPALLASRKAASSSPSRSPTPTTR